MIVEHTFEQLVQQGEVDSNWEATQKQVACVVCSSFEMLGSAPALIGRSFGISWLQGVCF